jgi:hypothetical protein
MDFPLKRENSDFISFSKPVLTVTMDHLSPKNISNHKNSKIKNS